MNSTETDNPSYLVPAKFPAFLVVYSPKGDISSGPRRTLCIGKNEIGREVAEPGWSFWADRLVTRLHAVATVSKDGKNLQIRDAQSKNGTFVNGQRIQQTTLQDGDVIRVGQTFLLVRWESPMELEDSVEITGLLGVSPAAAGLRAELADIARQPASVLLLGETGTGKEVAARALHQLSGRAGAFIAVNCGAIPEALAESMLFGHLAGAFSGARTASEGAFRAAHQGTLFLDELGELPASLQPKLLRVLDERAVTPVGATQSIPCDFRIVAATNRELRSETALGQFRSDLFARFAAFVVQLPPLRQRREDILLLFRHALSPLIPKLTARLIETLLLYHWPFNVREVRQLAAVLRRYVERGAVLDLPMIEGRLQLATTLATPASAELGRAPESAKDTAWASLTTAPLTREVLVRLMEENHGIIAHVAAVARRSRRHIRRLLEQFGLDRSTFVK